MQARVNIPGLSSRKIQKDIAAGEFTSTPEIQVCFIPEIMQKCTDVSFMCN